MRQGDDAAELRMLQAKAYGRGGGLTAAEALRLTRLESERAAPPADDGFVPEGETPEPPHPPVDAQPDPEHHSAPDAADPLERSPVLAFVRRYAKGVVAASLALLLIGVAAGWLLFGRDDEPALTSAQQERRAELQDAGEYDQGSVRLIAEDDDALVWYATQNGADFSCAILDVGEASQQQCSRVEDDDVDRVALSVSVSVPVADPDDPADEYGMTVTATVGRSSAGEVVAWVDRWTREDAVLDQYEGTDRTRAEALLDDGFLPGMSIVGYFHDEPVWLAERPADGTQTGGIMRCMIVDAVGDDASTCRAADDDATGISALSIEPAADGTAELWTLHLRFAKWGVPYLTIEQGTPPDVDISYRAPDGGPAAPLLIELTPDSGAGGDDG